MTVIPVAIPSDNIELVNWFQPQFEAVFLLLHPFYAVSPAFFASIGELDNLPARQEWRTLAQPVAWSEVTAGVGFPHRGVLHTTLLQNSLAIRSHDPVAIERLTTYLAHHSYLEPSNGCFDDLLLDSILDACAEGQQQHVYLASEFDPRVQAVPIETLRAARDPRLGKVHPVVWTRDQQVLFCVHWDSYFTCIAGPQATLSRWAQRYAWEGFFATPGLVVFWDKEPNVG